MTTPMPGPLLGLHRDDVDDLAHLLGRIEDWLRHADPDTRADLAAFLNGPGNGALAATGLLHALDQHTLQLRQLLHEQDNTPR
ncbi:hypothetical protein ABZ671_25255 [Micromonospora sp. NPDC006766]|uniref:hypothetical protein n=1 Tax=Micromonospora sp. NPDC006766 TaxID=3154778 RepID=UPI0033DE043C